MSIDSGKNSIYKRKFPFPKVLTDIDDVDIK